ncbi:hypothetical protein DMB92_04165 [Campylobacter sp. MIT 99-7217]|uniref:hypothetical protein n=1 Tax=Campylobacter sp. MIT 99-7217 TaxID=535091 RepID=UPI001158C769|nr:hypothetical protein [Campylobacter sp. MIT 99-7217]TQR33153.1 hypothetical protein DMB92_04165 [Campylobacter sp. MIT 99-7217]
MKKVTFIFLISVCVLFISCTNPIYTSFETSHANAAETLSGFKITQCNKILEKSYKNAEQRLIHNGLVDYKKKYYKNHYKIQINQYEVSHNAGSIMIKNSIGDILLSTPKNDKDAIFNISYDKKYLGICDKGKIRIFDTDNNLYELNQYKDMQCTEIYFSLDNTYLIVNNERRGQIYDFKTGKLVYDNPNSPIFVGSPYYFYYDGTYYPNPPIIDYVSTENEIISLNKGKRIVIQGFKHSYQYDERIVAVMEDETGLAVLVVVTKTSFIPFVSFQPFCILKALREM